MQLQSITLPTSNSYSRLISINNKEIIIATEIRKQSASFDGDGEYGIYKYDIPKNEWCLWIDYDKIWSTIVHLDSVLYDSISNEIIISGGTFLPSWGRGGSFGGDPHRTVHIKDGKGLKWDLVDYIYNYYGTKHGLKPFLFDNYEYHVIGMNSQSAMVYTIWNVMTKECIESYLSPSYGGNLVENGEVLYLRQRQKLLVLSGCIVRYYCLKTYLWSQMKDLPRSHFHDVEYRCCVTSDERYVIFVRDFIAVLDLDTMKVFGGGSINVPPKLVQKTSFECEIVSNYPSQFVKIISYGYIRNIIYYDDKNEFDVVIPMDLIGLISMFWFNEYLYVLDRGNKDDPFVGDRYNGNLWRMSVSDILQSNMYELEQYSFVQTSNNTVYNNKYADFA